MLELKGGQRTILADKLPDAGNLAAGALIFAQFLDSRVFSPFMALSGAVIWIFFVGCAIALARRSDS